MAFNNKLLVILLIFILCNLLLPVSIGSPFNNSISVVEGWYLINGSLISNESIDDYETKVNITDEISDDNDSTKYSITLSDIDNIFNFYYMFNDFSSSSAHDSSGYDNHLTIMSNAQISEQLDIHSLECTQQNGGGAKALHQDEFNILATNFSIGFIINYTSSTTSFKYILRKYEFPEGYYLYLDNTHKLRAFFRDSNGASDNILSTTSFNDGNPHSVVIRRNIGTGQIQMVIDGVVEKNGTVNTFGNYSNYANLEVGTISASSGFNGFLDEVFQTNTFMSDSEISLYDTKKHIYNEMTGDTIQVFFDKEINTTNSYSLYINKIDTLHEVPIRIYSLINSSHINTTNYVDSIISQGSNFVSIDNIIYDNYNQPFRIGNLHNDIEISEIALFEVGNDTTPPVIYNCYVNDSFTDCNDSIAWGCHVTDDSIVDNVWLRLVFDKIPNSVSRQAFQDPIDPTKWESKWDKGDMRLLLESFNWTFNSYLNVSLDYVNATDIAGNPQENSSFDPSIWNIYGCLICFEDWTAYYDPCQINDSQLKYYIDENHCNNTPYENPLPPDNGTFIYCNFCSEDLEQVKEICTYQNGTYVRNVTWKDNLYSFCCAITGIVSDCSIDYSPYNETTQEYCTIFNNTMECDSNTYTEYGFFGDKTRWICYPPVGSNSTTNCMSYVKDPSSGVIQTNPNYITKTSAFISIDNEYEDRTSFGAVGNMVSVYFTKDNIMFDGREYVFGVRCTSDGTYYNYEQLITPEYENVNMPITRFFWFKGNVMPIILGLLIGTIIMVLIVIAIAKVRVGWKGR